MSEERGNKVIDAVDKLEDSVNKITGVICVMQNIIKGLNSPCCLCVGCQTEDNRKGICNGFILKGDL